MGLYGRRRDIGGRLWGLEMHDKNLPVASCVAFAASVLISTTAFARQGANNILGDNPGGMIEHATSPNRIDIHVAMNNAFLNPSGDWFDPVCWSAGHVPRTDDWIWVTNSLGRSISAVGSDANPVEFYALRAYCYNPSAANLLTFSGKVRMDDGNYMFMEIGSNTTVRFQNAQVSMHATGNNFVSTQNGNATSHPKQWMVGRYANNWGDYQRFGENARLEFVDSTLAATNDNAFFTITAGHGGTVSLVNFTNDNEIVRTEFQALDNGTIAITNSFIRTDKLVGNSQPLFRMCLGGSLYVHDTVLTNASVGDRRMILYAPVGYVWEGSRGEYTWYDTDYRYSKDSPGEMIFSGDSRLHQSYNTSQGFFSNQGFLTGKMIFKDNTQATLKNFEFNVPRGHRARLELLDDTKIGTESFRIGGIISRGAASVLVDNNPENVTIFKDIILNTASNIDSYVDMVVSNGSIRVGGGDHPGILVAGTDGSGWYSGVERMPPAQAKARLEVSGGRLEMTAGGLSNHQLFGFVVGRNDGYSGIYGRFTNYGMVDYTGFASGELDINGGQVVNQALFAAGLGVGGTGVVHQTGGSFVHRGGCTDYYGWRYGNDTSVNTQNRYFGVGVGGGYGEYHVSGGTLSVSNCLYVGGVDTNYYPVNFAWYLKDWSLGGRYFNYFTRRSVGKMSVDGGTVSVRTGDAGRVPRGRFVLGADGTAELSIGASGRIEADFVDLRKSGTDVMHWLPHETTGSENPVVVEDGSVYGITENTTTVRWTAGADGVGVIDATAASVDPGVDFIVDLGAYRGAGWVQLMNVGQWAEGGRPSESQFTSPQARARIRVTDTGVKALVLHGTVITIL